MAKPQVTVEYIAFGKDSAFVLGRYIIITEIQVQTQEPHFHPGEM